MIDIEKIINIDDKKHVALLDTSSISFMQGLKMKGIQSEDILKDYDLILIPEWVLTEINDAPGRADYVQELIEMGYPIYCIKEESYSDLTNNEEGNLYQIVLASTRQLARIRSYLRRYVEKVDPLDMEAYEEWIQRLYDEWPISEEMLSTGRIKKKNAGEVSITILSEIISWYYPETKTLTIYSQDGDTYDFQRKDKMFSAINWKGKYKNMLGIVVAEGEWTNESLITMSKVFDYVVPVSKSRELAKNINKYLNGDKSILKWIIDFEIHKNEID